MEYRELGTTGYKVSRLCFGTLVLGPLEAALPVERAAELLVEAFRRGVNFVDTAESYGTYPHLRAALRRWDGEVVVASKSYAWTRRMARESVERARRELGRDVIDIFLLHEQTGPETLAGHREALEELRRLQQRGWVGAVGISTHSVRAVRAAISTEEVQVIHPLINYRGLGIMGGSLEEMLDAVRCARESGKAVYSMKALGGGNLLQEAERALQYVRDLPFVDSVAVGIQTFAELDYNVRLFSGIEIPDWLRAQVARKPRRLVVQDWCRGCGRCVDACSAGALRLAGGRVQVDASRCILCGYCAKECEEFCLKII